VAGVFGILLTALAAVRIISGQAAPTEASAGPATDASAMSTETLNAPVTTDQPLVAPVAARPTIRPIRRTSKPIEPSYTVQGGDSLSAIAARYSTTADAIQAINNLPDRSMLSVGQRLVIP
jgi:LysM repeat protein